MRLKRGYILSGLVMVGFAALLAYAFIQLLVIQKSLATYVGENMVWAITQTERDAGRLGETALTLPSGNTNTADLSLRLDVLYSRFALLADAPQKKYFARIPGGAQTIQRNADRLPEIEAMIDAEPDKFDPIAIYEALVPMREELTKVANDAMILERDRGGAQRDQQLQSIYLIMFAVLGIMATGAILSWQVFSNMRKAERAHKALQEYKQQLEHTVADRTAALREALESERKAKELYKSFITTVSHQFRTPVSIIDIIAQRFIRRADEFTPEIIVDKAKRMRNASRRLILLLESTANAERLDENGFQINRQPVDFSELVRNTCTYHQELHPELELVTNIQDSETFCYCDGILVEQILVNLLGNATKYSPADKPIEVTTEEDENGFRCIVRDYGIGIPAEDTNRIFTRFFRASNASHMAGTGLGLSLSRALAELHGGTLVFTSVEGQGTVFILTLPKVAPHATT
ncbi:sensor histidine kinase [Brucella anthropi]|uniref:sensor histidine kinase n=1 Tax=Brucella TaxID=234 RepID=UPI000569FEE6|nr:MULTISPECIES: HAMP domain-containing sensor histidine kinase [Brucella/Ochrobactrum group]KAB2757075.1 HAMP domain-containing histidine kinase [Brucella anthropi]MBA8860984.1 signal transduction histidine kinase [Brucella anthropi]MBM6397056.1 HAMP domain-containing histidine kinase [Brucella anthropi]NIH76348.1 signal transduction histidine kinase [Ochrobactrum sp. P20RRXII]PQZ64191.1 sensor histidine kinase [Ochrobactrum sp. MYb49]